MCVALPKRTFTLPFAERFHALIEMQAAPTVPHAVRCGHHPRASAPARMAYDNSHAPDAGTCRPMTDVPFPDRLRGLLCGMRRGWLAPVPTAVGAPAAGCDWICR